MTAKATLPEGFVYQPNFLDTEDEANLFEQFRSLEFKPFEFRSFLGNRRVVSFGFRYDFNIGKLKHIEPIPEFLQPIRDRTAVAFRLPADEIVQAMVTEYAAGAAIGWHRDRAVFDEVAGISLHSDCTFRFRRKRDGKWERVSLCLEPRSAYLLRGASRTDWQHSIPAVKSLRYSITFRTLRAAAIK
jgi:alkylated DNA repair dioxygenase AlkB